MSCASIFGPPPIGKVGLFATNAHDPKFPVNTDDTPSVSVVVGSELELETLALLAYLALFRRFFPFSLANFFKASARRALKSSLLRFPRLSKPNCASPG